MRVRKTHRPSDLHRLNPCAACVFVWTTVFVLAAARAFAQGFAPVTVGDITVTGSLRTRLESWEWFGGSTNGTYTYPGSLVRIGLGQIRKQHDWHLEFSVPLLFALPDQPAGAGPAGLGAAYFVANDRKTDAASFFAKQAFIRFKDVGGVDGQSLKIGRMEFFDGAEVAPKNETLAAIKRDRVAARLLANFGFTHVQRSVDGVQYGLDHPTINVTLLAARPTRGVFQVDGWGELNINVLYGAITRQIGDATNASEWRLFGLWYNDARDGVVKIDNRSLAARQADRGHLTIGTFGGHYIGALIRRPGTFDLLLWGAAQTGSWGEQLAHRAAALAVEAGWQPNAPLAPWIRAGFDYASGDHEPGDSVHGTFFQVLPTPRQYARFPFFNLMNSEDRFGELIVRPSKRLVTRADVHSLRLADGNDLWYQGGGAFQPTTFGYVGQTVNGHRSLATLYDISADITLTSRVSVTGYYGYAAGGPALAGNYPVRNDASLGYVELLLRF